CTDQIFTVYQKLHSPEHAIAYDMGLYFDTKPEAKMVGRGIRIRYRHRVFYDWLYAEVAPAFSQRDEFDWENQWSIFFRLEGVFGYDSDKAEIEMYRF
ncbi:MAG: hypothetical protein V7711_14775, partial [Pseudomonadales bacterium]